MIRRIITLSVVVAIALALAGCGTSGPQKPELQISIGCDYSGSVTEKERAEYCRVIKKLVSHYKGRASILVYKFSHGPEAMYEGRPRRVRDIIPLVKLDVIKGGKAKGEGTFYAPILRQFATDARTSDIPSVGVLLTDGYCDDPENTKIAAGELAECGNFRALLVAPVLSENAIRSRLIGIISPMESKTVVAGSKDLKFGIQTFLEKTKSVTKNARVTITEI